MVKKAENKVNKYVFWIPRILAIAFILFLMIFSFDVFDGSHDFWGTVLALFLHNIPSMILAIVLWLSWKREIVGGIVFILAGILLLVSNIVRSGGFDPWYIGFGIGMIVAGPAFIVGILFLVGWYKKRK